MNFKTILLYEKKYLSMSLYNFLQVQSKLNMCLWNDTAPSQPQSLQCYNIWPFWNIEQCHFHHGLICSHTKTLLKCENQEESYKSYSKADLYFEISLSTHTFLFIVIRQCNKLLSYSFPLYIIIIINLQEFICSKPIVTGIFWYSNISHSVDFSCLEM